MKRFLVLTVLMTLAATAALQAQPPMAGNGAQGQAVSVTGKITDLWSFLSTGTATADRTQALAHARSGAPLVIVDSQGQAWLLLSKDAASAQQDHRRWMQFLGQELTIRGMKATQGGLQGLYVESAQPAGTGAGEPGAGIPR